MAFFIIIISWHYNHLCIIQHRNSIPWSTINIELHLCKLTVTENSKKLNEFNLPERNRLKSRSHLTRLWRLCMDWTGPLALAFDILKRYFHFSCEIRCLFFGNKTIFKIPKTYLFGIGKVKAIQGALFTPLMKMGCSFLLGLKFLIKI